MTDSEKGYKLLHQFMKEVTDKLNRDFIYCVTGSLRDGKYIHGKSDIDIVVMPKKGTISPRAFMWMLEYGKKFGEIWKKGRMIPLFDVLIPMSQQTIIPFRKTMLDLEKEGKVKVFRVEKKKIEEAIKN